MVDETGCKISECAGDHDHTWQKQPEALLAHGVEPWSIGLKDHNDRHMPQVDSVLVSRHEVQWAKNPEIHFRQDGKAHEQYSKQNRKNGMSRITSRSRSVKAVAVIVKNPCQDQYVLARETGSPSVRRFSCIRFPACFQNAAAAMPSTKLSSAVNT